MKQAIVDVVIIGGGPAGLYATFYGGLRELSVTVLEATEVLGGKINFYPEKFVWDIGALPPSLGREVRANLIKQAQTFNPNIFLNSKACQINKVDDFFHVSDEQGRIHVCRAVLFAIGGGVVAPKKLSAEIADEVSDMIHYAFPNRQAITGKRLVVSGGGDAAVEYATQCLEYAAEVFIFYRGEKLKALEASVAKFKKNGGQFVLNTTIQEVRQGSSHHMELVTDQELFHADHLLVQHGYNRDGSLLDELSFALTKEDDFYLYCEEPTCTNIPGLFAAGDVQFSKGKLYLLAGAFQDAATSINQIKHYLDPQSHQRGMVSSHNHKFDELNQELFNQLSE
ncbi:MAG: NAD(P)/FAD-dependent oxidoreductase [Enterococcus sp.]